MLHKQSIRNVYHTNSSIVIFFVSFLLEILLTEMNDELDHATGIEKRELLAHLAGNDDPFHMKPIKRGPSTKDKPTLIPSAFEARIVGCICEFEIFKINNQILIFFSFES